MITLHLSIPHWLLWIALGFILGFVTALIVQAIAMKTMLARHFGW